MNVRASKLLIGLALLAQLVLAGAAYAEQEDRDSSSRTASNKNAGVDIYGY